MRSKTLLFQPNGRQPRNSNTLIAFSLTFLCEMIVGMKVSSLGFIRPAFASSYHGLSAFEFGRQSRLGDADSKIVRDRFHYCPIRKPTRVLSAQRDVYRSNNDMVNQFEVIDGAGFNESADFEEDDETDNFARLPKGSNDGFYVVKTYTTPKDEFDLDMIRSIAEDGDLQRLELTPQNISVPIALMLLDPKDYPSVSLFFFNLCFSNLRKL